MQSPFPTKNFEEEVALVVKHQMLPGWEHYGTKYLVIGTHDLSDYAAQTLPDAVTVRKRARTTPKGIRHKGSTLKSHVIESWPQDDQESLRWPGLFYVRSGVADLRIGDCVVSCPPGHFLLVPPGVPKPVGELPHLEEPRQNKQCEVWSFHSTGNYDYVGLSACYCHGDIKVDSGHYHIVNEPSAVQLFHIFSQELTSRLPYHLSIGVTALQMFLLLFLREIEAGRYYDRGGGQAEAPATPLSSPIEMARHYIDKNLHNPLTIATVSQAVFMGQSSFTKQFRAQTGQPFREYLIERRLEEAKHWLLRESCSLEATCRFIGMKPSRFHQLFQERFQMTPKEFRRRHKNT